MGLLPLTGLAVLLLFWGQGDSKFGLDGSPDFWHHPRPHFFGLARFRADGHCVEPVWSLGWPRASSSPLHHDKDGASMVRRLSVLAAIMAADHWRGLRVRRIATGNPIDPKTTRARRRPGLEAKSDDGVETEPTKIQAVDADAKNPKPFPQNNRSSGGWSSEAREIESHLGVGP